MDIRYRILFQISAVFFLMVCFASNGFSEPATDITIQGILMNEKGNVALVNNRTVVVGEVVNRATVLEIMEKGIRFTRDNQEFFQPFRNTNLLDRMDSASKKVQPNSKNTVNKNDVGAKDGVAVQGTKAGGYTVGKFDPLEIIKNAAELKSKIESRNRAIEENSSVADQK